MKDATEKFLGKQTVESTKTERRPSLLLPPVTVCPGFKKKPDGTYHVLPEGIASDMFTNELFQKYGTNATITVNETTDWWRNVTYGLDEIVDQFDVNGIGASDQDFEVSVKEAWTSRGRCYIFTSGTALDRFGYLGINFRRGSFESIGKSLLFYVPSVMSDT